MNKFIVLVMSIILAGCASSNYVAPTEGAIATLIIPSPKSSIKLLGGYSGTRVSFAVMNEDGCGVFIRDTEPNDPAESYIEITIPGNKDIFVRSEFSIGNTHCVPAGYFYAKESIRYTVKPLSLGNSCVVSVIGSEPGKEDKPEDIHRAYVDTWVGRKVCTNKDSL